MVIIPWGVLEAGALTLASVWAGNPAARSYVTSFRTYVHGPTFEEWLGAKNASPFGMGVEKCCTPHISPGVTLTSIFVFKFNVLHIDTD